MTLIRKFVLAALLAASALPLAPTVASAQQPAHGKFSLPHDVRWGSAKVPAGEYAFSFDPETASPVLILSKVSGVPTGFLMLVPSIEDCKPSDVNRLVLASTPEGSYVSKMQLPEFGMTLAFTVPSHPAEKQTAKAVTTASSGQ
jgi:hypothetical protein